MKMEIERSSAMAAKKIWNMVRIALLMLRKELSKTRMIMSDIHLMLKRGKLAGKAMINLIHLHHSNSISNISPQDLEYEFSCSNSPAFPAFYMSHYNNNNNKRNKHGSLQNLSKSDVSRVLEILNNEVIVEASPMVKQLRVSDSPFPVKDEGDSKVDEAAEAFIRRFYSNLKQQKVRAALESPSPYHDMWGR